MKLWYAWMIPTVAGADLFCKARVERMSLSPGEVKPICGGRLLLRRSHNAGMAFRIGEGRDWTGLSAGLTALTAAGFLFSLGKRGNGLLRFGLALVTGGGCSNTYDRYRRTYVVDYLSVPVRWKPLRNLVFNLADLAIAIGTLCTALGLRR